ncbi:tyrosine-type recombinase/integrase [Nonomuraea sp. NPDC049709]|uniref:tyrosine-type recombinase/integrase n=1 Tax=Nonomuraea sp. NPDC049709 TaxID=3154736 RepID=UPI0034348BD7
MLESWSLALKSANRSAGTITSYRLTVTQFCDYLHHHRMPDTVDGVDAAQIRTFLAACMEGCWKDPDTKEIPCDCGTVARSPGNAHKHWRNLKAFFNWLINEGERHGGHPMANVGAPKVPDNPTAVFSDDELRALLKVAGGSDFADRRDTALMRLFMDIGARVSGLADLRYSTDPEESDVQLKQGLLRIRLKGGNSVFVPIGAKAARDLDRYIRARARHPNAGSEWLWLGPKGRLTTSGIRQMLRRRGKQAGVTNVHPHRFRHTMADDWLEAGGNPQDLMRIAGWKSLHMVLRYGRSAADRRAQQAHAKLSPGDRI